MTGKIPQVRPLQRIPHVDHFFQTHGYAVIADWISDQIRCVDADVPVVVSGCRMPEEVLSVRRHRPNAKSVAIHASLSDRFLWLRARGRADAPESIDELFRLTAWEMTLGLANILYRADAIEINDGSLDRLWQSILSAAKNDDR